MTPIAPDDLAMLGALPDPKLDENGCLVNELACRRCGYALRGLRPGGACPECRTPVDRSLKGNLLQYSDPDWVSSIARGGQWLALSSILYLAVPLAMLPLRPIPAVAAGLGVALAAVKAMQTVGFWLATSAEPAMLDRESAWSPRIIARWSSLASSAIMIASHLSATRAAPLLLTPIPGAASQPAVVIVVGLAVAALQITAGVALLMHARTLALRLTDIKLWRQCNGVALLYAITLGARSCHMHATALIGAPIQGPFAVVGPLVQLAALMTIWWCVILIFRFRRRLNDAAQLARDTWARP